jgi:nucleoside 2-deoxyribosyltransferase
MQKKYQVFVSSTFRDLVDERQDTLRHILDLGHIPAGMELFPASNAEQLEYIKKIIDECDYYVLIIGGRYGSMDSDGVSFTDREYEYAIESGKPVLAFIHDDPGKLAVENSDIDQRILARLSEFRERVSKGRLVQFWTSRDNLALSVLKSLAKAFQESPQVGWIRASAAASEDLLQQLNSLRNENDSLNIEIRKIRSSSTPKVEGLANLNDVHSLYYKKSNYYNGTTHYTKSEFQTTWMELFSVIGPKIFSPLSPTIISKSIKDFIDNKNYNGKASITIQAEETDKIKIQFIALNLIKAYQAGQVNGGLSEFIEITDFGKKTLLETMSVKSNRDI